MNETEVDKLLCGIQADQHFPLDSKGDLQAAMQLAFEALNVHVQTMLRMRFLEDKSPQDIANEANADVRTVQMLLLGNIQCLREKVYGLLYS